MERNDKYSPTADPKDCEEDRFPEKEYKTILKNAFTEIKKCYP